MFLGTPNHRIEQDATDSAGMNGTLCVTTEEFIRLEKNSRGRVFGGRGTAPTDKFFHCDRTSKTGSRECCTIFSATLPSSQRPIPDLP
jgi:hypothetical protein